MPRCKACDYSTDTANQSQFFQTLPDNERRMPRRQLTLPSGEVVVVCKECAGDYTMRRIAAEDPS